MRRPTRPSNALPILLVVLLLGMSASATLYHDDRAELADDRPALEAHSGLYSPGSQEGSIYSDSTLAASSYFTCVVLDETSTATPAHQDGTMKCWGDGATGKLGNGSWSDQHVPGYVQLGYSGGPSLATEYYSYGHFGLARMIDGSIQGWGENGQNQIGCDTSPGGDPNCWWGGGQNTPLQTNMPSARTAIQVSPGLHHSCAIMDDQSVWCWGQNAQGQIGNGNAPVDVNQGPVGVLMPAGRTAVALAGGSQYSCAVLDDGSAVCWGSNNFGQLGIGNFVDMDEPTAVTAVPSNRTIAAISGSQQTTYAILDDGSLVSWGRGQNGQFGDGTYTATSLTARYASLPAGRTAISIAGGLEHVCAILDDNSAWCWGNNSYGQIGDGTTGTSRPLPTSVSMPGGQGVYVITTGSYHTCAIVSNASVHCWGSHEQGELGLGWDSLTVEPRDSDIPAWVDLSGQNTTSGGHASLGERDADHDGILSIFDPTPWPVSSCPPGQYLFDLHCVDASPGHYVPYFGMTEEFPCPEGTYNPDTGQSSCYDTTPGHYTNSTGSITETDCPPGTYQPDYGQTSCLDVDRGHYSDAGSVSGTPCAPTTYQPDTGQPSCLDADPGHYVTGTGQLDQTACSPGTYQPVAGQSGCFSASEGHYAPGFGSAEQLACEPGTYSPSTGRDACLPADTGYYVTDSGAIEQVACPTGSHQPTPASIGCSLVNPGFYAPAPGTAFEIPCPSGTYQPDPGSDHCIDVDIGHHASDLGNFNQYPCDPGTYASEGGMSDCLAADPGHTVLDSGASSQTACEAGEHQPDSGAATCLDNEIGHYTDQTGTAEQIPCSPGTYQSSIGQTACMEADYGFHVPYSGSAGQTGCYLGTYQSSTGQASCTDAEPGYFVSEHEASVPTACERGTYQPDSGQIECIEADYGYYVASMGSPSQTPCERGTYQTSGGQHECTDAEPGYFVSTTAALHPNPCVPGTYQDSSGKMNCKEADVDHYVAESAATGQSKCTDGATQPLRGQTSCNEADNTMLIMGGAAALAVIALTAMYMNSQKKEQTPKRRKKIDPNLGHLGAHEGKRRKRPSEGKQRRRRPPKGKRRKRPPSSD